MPATPQKTPRRTASVPPSRSAPKAGALDQPDLESRGYEKGRATRRHIVQVASREFAQNGFKATSVDQISAAAGLTKGAVTGHFRLKRDLYVACLKYTLGFLAEMDEIEPGSSPEQGLLRFITRLGSHLSADSNTRALLIQLQREVDDEIRDEIVRAVLTEPFRQLRFHIEGVNPKLDSAAYAFLIFSQLLLDADQHVFYHSMAKDAARAHGMKSTICRLVAIVKTTRED